MADAAAAAKTHWHDAGIETTPSKNASASVDEQAVAAGKKRLGRNGGTHAAGNGSPKRKRRRPHWAAGRVKHACVRLQ